MDSELFARHIRYAAACGELKQAAEALAEEALDARRYDYDAGLSASERTLQRAINRVNRAAGAVSTERVHLSLALGEDREEEETDGA